jgi:hypothetical protein
MNEEEEEEEVGKKDIAFTHNLYICASRGKIIKKSNSRRLNYGFVCRRIDDQAL